MALTVTAVVNEVVGRTRGKLAAVGLSVARDDTNPDVVPAVRKALSWVGRSPVDPAAVTDADLAGIAGPQAERFFDAAVLEALYVALGAAYEVDQTVGKNSQKLSQIQEGIQAMIGALEARLKQPYGPFVPAGAMGSMSAGEPMPSDPLNPRPSFPGPGDWPYPQR